MRLIERLARLVLPAIFVIPLSLSGCDSGTDGPQSRFTDIGDSDQGKELIRQVGCGACHQIPGIDNARGQVGPPLKAVAERHYIAGVLQNTPDNMIRWLLDPQAIIPGNAMPDTGLNEEQARHITAYLYSLE